MEPRQPRQEPTPRSERSTAQRARFCDFLRAQRTVSALSIEEIARVTRIPVRSLEQLESGRFEELPADVFVRGFLSSYARCVGLDCGEVLRRYTQCGLVPAPVASELARGPLAAVSSRDVEAGEGVVVLKPTVSDDLADDAAGRTLPYGAEPVRHAAPSGAARKPAARPHPRSRPDRNRRKKASHAPRREVAKVERPRAFLPPAWAEGEGAPRRGPLTLAVIVLVIVATLAMSYLLRRPSYSGDGVTQRDAVAATLRV